MSWTPSMRNMSAEELVRKVETDLNATEREHVLAHYLGEALDYVMSLNGQVATGEDGETE